MVSPNIMITSDGTGMGTFITDGAGRKIKGVSKVTWTIDNNRSVLKLEFIDYPIKMTLNAYPELIKMRRLSWKFPFYLSADVHPENFGIYYSFGYRVVK